MLFGLLLRFAGSVSHLHSVDEHRGAEERTVRRIALVVTRLEKDCVVVLLAPLNQPALEVS